MPFHSSNICNGLERDKPRDNTVQVSHRGLCNPGSALPGSWTKQPIQNQESNPELEPPGLFAVPINLI